MIRHKHLFGLPFGRYLGDIIGRILCSSNAQEQSGCSPKSAENRQRLESWLETCLGQDIGAMLPRTATAKGLAGMSEQGDACSGLERLRRLEASSRCLQAGLSPISGERRGSEEKEKHD